METYYIIRSDDYLAHHGVKGMKWGVRRYQNKDGSLTARGKEVYGNKNVYGKYNAYQKANKEYRKQSRKIITSKKHYENVNKAAEKSRKAYLEYNKSAEAYMKKTGRYPKSYHRTTLLQGGARDFMIRAGKKRVAAMLTAVGVTGVQLAIARTGHTKIAQMLGTAGIITVGMLNRSAKADNVAATLMGVANSGESIYKGVSANRRIKQRSAASA